MSAPSPSTEPEPSPAERARRNVYRHLANSLRLELRVVPCEPDTPEARSDRDTAVIEIAMSLNPQSDAEIMYAVAAVVAATAQALTTAELVLCRGDILQTGRVIAQSASLSRKSNGALNALLKLQRERQRLSSAEASQARAAGRIAEAGLNEALQALAPPAHVVPGAPAPQPAATAPQPAAPDPAAPDPAVAAGPTPMRDAPGDDAPGEDGLGEDGLGEDAPGDDGLGEDAPSDDGLGEDGPGDDGLGEDGQAPAPGHLGRIWAEAERFCAAYPDRAQAIRRHRGAPPGCGFPLPSPAVMHALLHATDGHARRADSWRPGAAPRVALAQPIAVAA
jgi:hypothetical protein